VHVRSLLGHLVHLRPQGRVRGQGGLELLPGLLHLLEGPVPLEVQHHVVVARDGRQPQTVAVRVGLVLDGHEPRGVLLVGAHPAGLDLLLVDDQYGGRTERSRRLLGDRRAAQGGEDGDERQCDRAHGQFLLARVRRWRYEIDDDRRGTSGNVRRG
jgi:hypothetical protein